MGILYKCGLVSATIHPFDKYLPCSVPVGLVELMEEEIRMTIFSIDHEIPNIYLR